MVLKTSVEIEKESKVFLRKGLSLRMALKMSQTSTARMETGYKIEAIKKPKIVKRPSKHQEIWANLLKILRLQNLTRTKEIIAIREKVRQMAKTAVAPELKALPAPLTLSPESLRELRLLFILLPMSLACVAAWLIAFWKVEV